MSEEYQQQYIFDEEGSVLELKLTNFSGPLDLLWRLSRKTKSKLRIYSCPKLPNNFWRICRN